MLIDGAFVGLTPLRLPELAAGAHTIRLELDGHRVEVARDGPAGVALALATAPDVAFIDIGLAGIDGHEVGRRIRAALGRRVLLVALTAHGREQDRRRSSQAGFDAHLLKPASYEDLTWALARAAGGEAAEEEG